VVVRRPAAPQSTRRAARHVEDLFEPGGDGAAVGVPVVRDAVGADGGGVAARAWPRSGVAVAEPLKVGPLKGSASDPPLKLECGAVAAAQDHVRRSGRTCAVRRGARSGPWWSRRRRRIRRCRSLAASPGTPRRCHACGSRRRPRRGRRRPRRARGSGAVRAGRSRRTSMVFTRAPRVVVLAPLLAPLGRLFPGGRRLAGVAALDKRGLLQAGHPASHTTSSRNASRPREAATALWIPARSNGSQRAPHE
jgi:hypothetical protein